MNDKYLVLYFTVFFASLLLTILAERYLISYLSGRAAQPIYSDGPKWHAKKAGTPTMGGVGFIFASFLTLMLSSAFLYSADKNEEALSIFVCAVFAVLNALIGIADDVTKIKRKNNKGLSAMQKLILQLTVSIIFLVARRAMFSSPTTLIFSFGELDLGKWYYPFALIALLGTINCANLTDGIDGLASSVAGTIGLVLLLITSLRFNDVAIVSASIIGAALGFLIYNRHPARIFMGDTGSLFLGALTVSCVFALGNPIIMIFIGACYLIEGLSVILQVIYFKLTGKRLFKMAPLHHHLEKCGMTEPSICMLAILVTLICSIPVFGLFFA